MFPIRKEGSNISLNSYLDDVASKLIIKGDQKESIKKSLDVFCERMKDYFRYHEAVNLKEIKVFGSYDRDTNIPQYVDYGTDVDIMLVMDDDGCTPQTYLDRVRRAVEAKYSTSEIKQSSPTIVLQMLHIKFEITPAIIKYYTHYIKKSESEWMPTYCYADLSYITEANKENYFMIKPVLRLVKYWNVSKNYKSFSSYRIEQLIVSHYSICQYQGYDTKQYLLTGLQQIKSLVTYDSQRERLEKAIAKVQEAIDDEPIYQTVPYEEIKEVIAEL